MVPFKVQRHQQVSILTNGDSCKLYSCRFFHLSSGKPENYLIPECQLEQNYLEGLDVHLYTYKHK